ncbi:MAG: hypothetical protein H7Z42_15705, partial [Roseiflexaceae bacterium]|nr:hypothetical protein [Roseiflexaceae bacterium]
MLREPNAQNAVHPLARRFSAACVWLLGAVVLLAWLPAPAFSAEPASQLEILAVDAASHPEITLTVRVRDASGRGVGGLRAEDFIVEEQRTIPGERLTLEELDVAAPITIALVPDLSALLGERSLAQIRADGANLLAQLSQNGAVELGLFVPRAAADASLPLQTLAFTADSAIVAEALDETAPRSGQTDLYNAVAAAISATAERAAARGGPAAVIVFGDGLDRTSIVGSGASGANQAAQLAETRRVQVLALGYGTSLRRGEAILTQLADRAGGVYQGSPDAAALDGLAERLRAEAQGGTYRLRYSSLLEADGANHPLGVRLQVEDRELSAQTETLLPRSWSTAAAALDMQLDDSAYPRLSVLAQPLTRQQQLVPNLTAQDFQLLIGDTALPVPVEVQQVPLDPADPAATQSLALVVNNGGAATTELRERARELLRQPDEPPIRAALFMPGVPADDVPFTHDHNALINQLNQALPGADEGGSLGATLLLAIDAAARDGAANRRPASVAIFADAPLLMGDQARAANLARDLGVTLHTVAAGDVGELARLADATEGTARAADDATASALFAELTKRQATRYLLAVDSPLLADGAERELTLQVGEQAATAPLRLFAPGSYTARAPVGPPLLALAFAGVTGALLLAAIVPRRLEERRLRCSACGNIRRLGWSDCLFCERIALDQRAPADSLAGFAAQGAALAATPQVFATPATPAAPLAVQLAEAAPAREAQAEAALVLAA